MLKNLYLRILHFWPVVLLFCVSLVAFSTGEANHIESITGDGNTINQQYENNAAPAPAIQTGAAPESAEPVESPESDVIITNADRVTSVSQAAYAVLALVLAMFGVGIPAIKKLKG